MNKMRCLIGQTLTTRRYNTYISLQKKSLHTLEKERRVFKTLKSENKAKYF